MLIRECKEGFFDLPGSAMCHVSRKTLRMSQLQGQNSADVESTQIPNEDGIRSKVEMNFFFVCVDI